MDTRTWTIAELAREFGVTARTLRFYEEHGLLEPERRGMQRVFHSGDRVRLELVLRGKRLGFPLEEIKKIVGMYDADTGETGQLTVRRSELEQRRSDIERTLAELADLERRCRDDLVRLGSAAADQGVRT